MSELKPTDKGQAESRDASSLTLSQLISSIKPAQAWAVATAFVAILGGSFGLGYKLGTLNAQAETGRLHNEVADLQGKIKEFRAIQTKERFLGLYLRYLIAKDDRAADDSEANREAVDTAGARLRSHIEDLLERGEEKSDDIDMRGLFLGKSPGAQATVKFGYDGTVWPLPNEFGFASYAR
jgi:hypothetical protein